MSSSRRRPELRLSISQGRDGSQYHRGGTPEKSPSSGKYFLLTSPFIEQIILCGRGPALVVEEQTPVLEEWPVAAQALAGLLPSAPLYGQRVNYGSGISRAG